MKTLKDIAKAVGCTPMAASYALRGRDDVSADLQDRVREAAKRMGYVVNAAARGLRNQRSGLIAVVLDSTGQLGDDLLSEIQSAGFDAVPLLPGVRAVRQSGAHGVEGVLWLSRKRRGEFTVPVAGSWKGLLARLTR